MEWQTLDRLMSDLGVGEMQPRFIAGPLAINADGRVFECHQDSCAKSKNATTNTTKKSENGFNVQILLHFLLSVVAAVFVCGLALSCFLNRRRLQNYFCDELSAMQEKIDSCKDLNRRVKEMQERRDEIHSTKFASAGVKLGEFRGETVKRSINLSQSNLNGSTLRGNGNAKAHGVEDLKRKSNRIDPGINFVNSASVSSSRIRASEKSNGIITPRSHQIDGNESFVAKASTPEQSQQQKSRKDIAREGSSMFCDSGPHENSIIYHDTAQEKTRTDDTPQGGETYSESSALTFRSNISLVASLGGSEHNDGRLDTLVIRQQRLQLQLDEMNSGKNTKKKTIIEREVFPRPNSATPRGAPSLWAPPDVGLAGHRDFDVGESIQFSTNSVPQRIGDGANMFFIFCCTGG